MKLAPWVAGSALAVLVITLATAKAVSPPDKLVPIEFGGVDTLEAYSDGQLTVVIDSTKPAGLEYPDREDSIVKVRRDGSRLIVDGKFATYAQLTVTVPGTVHRFVVSGGIISGREKLAEAEVLSSQDFGWRGDVGRLLLRDTADASKHAHDGDKGAEDDCTCGSSNTITVYGGQIGELRAWSPHATLSLPESGTIGVVYADLGPKGGVTVTSARRFDQIHVVGAEASTSTDPNAELPTH